MIVSPLFHRELVILARKRSTYLLRALFVGGVLVALGLTWGEAFEVSRMRGVVDLAEVGEVLFRQFMYAQFWAAALLTPGLAASLVARERERNTLGLLLLTNLPTWRIVVDKTLARLLTVVLLLLAGVPLALSFLPFHSVDAERVLATYGAVLAAVLLGTGVSALGSALTGRVAGGLALAYLALLLLYLAPVLPLVLLVPDRPSLLDPNVVGAFFPLQAFRQALAGQFDYALYAPLFCLVLMGVCLWAACRLVARGHQGVTAGALATTFYGAYHRLMQVGGRLGQSVVLRAGADEDPLFRRESRYSLLNDPSFVLRCAFGLLLAMCISFPVFVLTDFPFGRDLLGVGPKLERLFAVFMALYIPLLVTYALVVSASAFSGEREAGTLDLLLSTPMRGARLAGAKIVGVVQPLVAFATVPCAFFLAVSAVVEYVWYGHWAPAPVTADAGSRRFDPFLADDSFMPTVPEALQEPLPQSLPPTTIALAFLVALLLALLAAAIGLKCSTYRRQVRGALLDATLVFGATAGVILTVVMLTSEGRMVADPLDLGNLPPFDLPLLAELRGRLLVLSWELLLFCALSVGAIVGILHQFVRHFDQLVGRV